MLVFYGGLVWAAYKGKMMYTRAGLDWKTTVGLVAGKVEKEVGKAKGD